MRTTTRTLITVAALLALLAGCAGEADDTGDTATQPTTPEVTDTATTEPSPEATSTATDEPASPSPSPDATGEPTDGATGMEDMNGTPMVDVTESSLGEILVDEEGRTLYLFEPDEGGAPTCEGDCATNWPPLLTEGDPHVGDNADDSKIGTADRPDGTTQVTYGGWPVYYFAGDSAPGDVNGQGVGGVWWVLDRDGEPLRENLTDDASVPASYRG